MGKVNARVQQSFMRLKPEREKTSADDNRNGGNHTGGGDEPPGGTDVQTRIAKLESQVEYIRRDLNSVVTDVKELRNEMREEFKGVAQEFKAVREEFREEFKVVRQEFKAVREEIKTESKDVRKEMREDFRILFGALIALGLGIAGLMAKGFGWF